MTLTRVLLAATVTFALLLADTEARAQSFLQAIYNYDSSSSGITEIDQPPWPSFLTTAGNTVVVYARCSGSSTNTFAIVGGGSNTWNGPYYAADGNGNERAAMFYAQNIASPGTDFIGVSFGTSCGRASLIIMEFSGTSASALDGGPVFSSHASGVTSATSGSLTTTNPNDILVMCADPASAAETSYTAGSGYTIPTVGNTSQGVCEFKIVSSIQTGASAGVGWNASSSYDTVFFALKGGGGSTSQTVDFFEGCSGPNTGSGTCGRWLVADGGSHGIAPYTFQPDFDPGAGAPMMASISPTTAFQDDYFYTHMAAPDSTTNFTYCTTWLIPNSGDENKFQAIETDFHHARSDGWSYTGGVQFLSKVGGGPAVRLFDLGGGAWHAVNGLTMPLTDNNAHSLCYSFTNDHTNHTTKYTSITIDGSTTPLGVLYSGKQLNWNPVLNVAVQLDGDSSADAYALSVWNWSVSF